MRQLFFLLLILISIQTFAQDSVATYKVSMIGHLSQNDPTPFWLVHGRYGIIDPNQNELILAGDVNVPFYFGKKWKLETGLQLVGKSEIDNSFLQEVYLNVQYGSLKLIAGKQELTFTQYSEDLSCGSYYLSNNARPIPRIGLGFYDYTDVPFTNGYLQIKGFLNQGILDDDRGPSGTDRPLFHEKIAYIRTNKLVINPHIGINHSALFGGTRPDGTKIPVDYWAVFFGKSSDEVGDAFPGEGTNVAGAHLGLFDVGFNFDIKNIHVQTYYQKPFSDGSGFWQFFERNHDHLFGIVANVQDGFFVEEFAYENMSTQWQSGPGSIDPYVNGQAYVIGEIDDYDQFLYDNFGIETEGTTEDEFVRFLERAVDYGFPFGGRDNYYNNGLYYRGWSYWGQSLGTPLFLSEDRVWQFNPDFDGTWDKYFVNNRIKSHHFGVKGNITKDLSYKIKYTYTRNYGTYFGLNKGAYIWDSADPYSTYDYYFQEKLSQHYLLIEPTYQHPKITNLSFSLSIGADYGDMYNSFGVLVGAYYSGDFQLFKTQNK